MKPEDDPIDPSADAQVWLDGLAGRGGDHTSAKEGARLRDALLPSVPAQENTAKHTWAQLVAVSRRPTDTVQAAAASAANQRRWRLPRLGGLAALLLVCVGVAWVMRSMTDPSAERQLRGLPSSQGAVWRTQDPLRDAQGLAARLKAAGARVNLIGSDAEWVLEIDCAPAARANVDAELFPLEAAVDNAGHLRLRVLHAP